MRLIRIKSLALFCLIIPLFVLSQYNEDIQISSESKQMDVTISKDNIFHILHYTSGVDGFQYMTLDTLFNQISIQSYPWAYPFYPCIDTRNSLTAMAWINQDRSTRNKSIKGAVFNSNTTLYSSSVITLSDSVEFSFSGTTHSTPAISFLNDTLLVAIWIQADPDIDHFSIFGQLFTSSNKLIGSNFKINDQYREEVDCGHRPILHSLHSDSGFVVVWMDHPNKGGELYGRIFNINGTARDSSFSITGDYQHYIAGLVYFSMDMDSLDNILASFSAWDDSYRWNIYYRWLDINGTPLSDIDTITNIPYNVREMSGIKCNISCDGRSIITWQVFEDSRRVFCQRFDSDHNPMDLPFCVSHSDRSTDQDNHYSFLHKDQIYSFWNESYSNWSSIIEFDNPPVSISNNLGIVTYSLSQNYPNPFNPITTLSYKLPEQANVEMMIFDISGRKIKKWSYQDQQVGTYEITWNGKDQSSNQVPSGVYIYRMVAGEFVESRKMVLLK